MQYRHVTPTSFSRKTKSVLRHFGFLYLLNTMTIINWSMDKIKGLFKYNKKNMELM